MTFINNTRKTLTILTMLIAIVAIPNTASARGSLHISLPHLSIGSHGGHHNKHYNRRYNSHHYNNYYRPQYRSNSYNQGYATYRNYQPRYNQRSYYQPRYNQPRYNNSGYCPTPGYSSNYYDGGGCYSHGDHYHCDQ